MTFKPYPGYKDSGVPWLGKVPTDWDTRKIKYLFSERVQKGFSNEPLLAATQSKGVVPKTHYENRTVVAQKDLHLLKLVEKGDFVISLRSFQGGIELAYYRGIISPAYTVMIPCKNIDNNYFKYLAKSITFIGILKTCVTGIREGQNIDYEVLKRNRIPLPLFDEQTQIARFLDYKSSQIARFIRAKKRMIELLKEQIDLCLFGQNINRCINHIATWETAFPEKWTMRKAKRIFGAVKNSGDGICHIKFYTKYASNL
ncbi:MAG: restriction endonuclease subunit S [Candidatus Scalindua sp.]